MDNDPHRIDSHKLHLHPRRVADWLDGQNIAPVYVEVSPSGACNHRCRFCAKDFYGYRPRTLPTERFCQFLGEMGAAGVRSIMYAGEGEPFLHKDMAVIAQATKAAGIDAAFTTNAVKLTPETAERVLPVTSWIKVSCNAGTPETYAAVHGTRASDFDRVMENMAAAVALRRRSGLHVALGFQMILLPENRDEAVTLARTVRELGADYFVVKPYSQHPQSLTRVYADLQYDDCAGLAERLEACAAPDFKVIFRRQALHRAVTHERSYARCLALPFWAYIDAGGDLWGCSMHLGDERYRYGNVLSESFEAIWGGKRRQENMAWCAENLDATHCRVNCRMDAVNRYLWELTHPEGHVNFI